MAMPDNFLENNGFTPEQRTWYANHGKPVSGTNDQMVADVARQLFDASVYANEKQVNDLVQKIKAVSQTYDLESLATAAGVSADSARTASKILADDYYKVPQSERDLWNAGVNLEYGPGGSEKMRRVIDAEKRNREYADRHKIGTAAKVLGTIFAPRSLEAIQSGQAEGWKDALLSKHGALDLGENVLMALPFGGWAGLISKGARGAKAAKAAASAVLGAAAAPHAVEAMDWAAYHNTPEQNPDRAVYSEGDALLGTGTNLVAPWVLGEIGNNMGKWFGYRNAANEGAQGVSQQTLDILKDMKKTGEWVKPSKESIDAVSTINGTMSREEAAASVGASQFAEASTKEAQANSLRLQAGDLMASGHIVDNAPIIDYKLKEADKLDKEAKALRNKKMTKLEEARVSRAIEGAPRNDARDYIEAGFLEKRARDIDEEFLKKRARDTESKGIDYGMGMKVGELLELAKSSDKYKDKISDILRFGNEFQNADYMDYISLKNPALRHASDAVKTLFVNKYGSKRDADLLTGQVSRLLANIDPRLNMSQILAEKKQEAVDRKLRDVQKSQAGQILSMDKTLTDEDRDWLKKIQDNPSIVNGIGEGNSTRFRNWFLLRGQDIMRGTSLFRPTPSVE